MKLCTVLLQSGVVIGWLQDGIECNIDEGMFDANLFDISDLSNIQKHIRHFDRKLRKWTFKNEYKVFKF